MKYHVSTDGPRRCKAEKGGCPYEEAGKPHFDNQEDAQAHYDKTMEDQFGFAPSMSKTEKTRQKVYATTDTAQRKVSAAKHAVQQKMQRMKDRTRNAVQKSSEKASESTRQASLKVAQFATTQNDTAREKVQQYSSTAKPRVVAAARIASKSAQLIGRDIAKGARTIDNKYRIRARASAALQKITKPVSNYTRTRAKMISRIARTEMANSAPRQNTDSIQKPSVNAKPLPKSVLKPVEKVSAPPRKPEPHEMISFRLHNYDGSHEDIGSAWLYDKQGTEQKVDVKV